MLVGVYFRWYYGTAVCGYTETVVPRFQVFSQNSPVVPNEMWGCVRIVPNVYFRTHNPHKHLFFQFTDAVVFDILKDRKEFSWGSYHELKLSGNRDGSVGTVSHLRAWKRGFESSKEREIFLAFKMYRPSLEPSQAPILWVSGILSWRTAPGTSGSPLTSAFSWGEEW